MIKAIVIDDESAGRGIVLQNIERFFKDTIEVVGEADSVKSGVMLINKKKPEMVFLDVQMKDGTGFDLLDMLPELDFSLVFVTSFDQYALKAIKYSAVDYLLKPIDPDEFKSSIDSVIRKINKEEIKIKNESLKTNIKSLDKLALPSQDGIYMIDIDDIIRCESDNNYTKFYLTEGRKFMVSRTLKEYDELLSDRQFCRVHKSHLVNLNHVEKYVPGEGGYLILSGKNHVDVSRRRKEELVERLL